ncbi:type II toxin-antitoxin system VapC family toxin [Ornithinimicrobium cryptoxanthini]|uniref:Type II toxin-antitoxin system VapC family toxin n=2 Tax=Ornithinimicrobium cryptoxanthini TaxID=2934161 RepID=A0ABY4YIF8_9MICO|nr:type II toxin-antitoxin system VapC family toxin [Ornithinimicrobium cryptoxanthini]USQ76546.1 type II toxin-antitoxin system VapC family toxin [Ornithinimicrobium cryptoxanthini]
MAILQGEPGAEELTRAVAAAPCRMSAATWLEVGIVADQRSAAHGERLNQLIELLGIEIVPVTAQHGAVARQAYRRYGRGNHSGAALNFGDVFSYALSVVTGEPLLFVGDDFPHTDVAAAIAPR